MSNRPRTPEYFPRMKNRAAARRARSDVESLGDALQAFAKFARDAADAIFSLGRHVFCIFDSFSSIIRAVRQDIERMPPADRAKFLANLPPEQRPNIVREFRLIPPMKELTR